jgi:O-antigen/teichoic acid export membrane protein
MRLNTKHIAKNTLVLYIRQILILLVGLYTVRIILNTLGTDDYGIYNVVAGVVGMFTVLSTTMAIASQRYFSFEIGRKNVEQLKKVFDINFIVYVILAVFVLLIGETIGLWFIHNKLTIPVERTHAAFFIYHFAIISLVLTILTTPYMALILAHEEMNIYAYMSIVETLSKLIVVFLLKFILMDKLQLYGILTCVVTLINAIGYRIICRAFPKTP